MSHDSQKRMYFDLENLTELRTKKKLKQVLYKGQKLRCHKYCKNAYAWWIKKNHIINNKHSKNKISSLLFHSLFHKIFKKWLIQLRQKQINTNKNQSKENSSYHVFTLGVGGEIFLFVELVGYVNISPIIWLGRPLTYFTTPNVHKL